MSKIIQYIEKQKVRKFIEGWKPDEDDYDTRYDFLAAFDLWDGCCCEITAAPAADVAPVVHGHWITVYREDGTKADKCSVCTGAVKYFDYKYGWCPHCGAKMESEVNNNGK